MTILDVIKKATIARNKVYVVKDDGLIVDYMIDINLRRILKEFQSQNTYNTGVAMWFDPESDKKTLVMIMSMKFFKAIDDNGLIAVIVDDMHINPNGIEMMKDLIKVSIGDSVTLEESVLNEIEKHVSESINYHAGY